MSNDKKQQRWIIGSKRFTAMVVTLAAFLVLLGLYVSGSDAVRTELVMLGAVLCLFIIIFIALSLSNESRYRGNNSIADGFRKQIENGEYFNKESWQKEYDSYCAGHPLKSLSALSFQSDISCRYLRRLLKIFWICVLIPFISLACSVFITAPCHAGLFGFKFFWTVLAFACMFATGIMGFLYLLSFRPFSSWLGTHPKYREQKDEIKNSYIEGDAFTCSCNSVVVGKKYVHAFDGTDFFTEEKDNLKDVKVQVERLMIYTHSRHSEIYVEDEYHFRIVFCCGEGDILKEYGITLDQFQVKMIMDRFFPDVSWKVRVAFTERRTYYSSFASMRNCISEPVMDDNAQ